MKILVTGFLLLLLAPCMYAQGLKTIVPRQPVVAGTAFQVQYIITRPDELLSTEPPEFKGFRVVSGPNHYKGNALIDGKIQPIENVTYTLVSDVVGDLRVEGLKARFKNSTEAESGDAVVTLIPQPRVSFSARSSYTDLNLYAPSSQADLDKMIEENLFILAEVDRKSCYVGEPIVATFRLYSRLQSASELLRAPALYGFSVMDMLAINESHQEIQTLGDKIFNTSTLRKVQLFPEQPGKLVIDEMVVNNEIHFDDSVKGNTTLVERELKSKPLTINVKPFPVSKPENFTGAVGKFKISARFEKDSIAANQEGKMILTIRGKGNFIQFAPPTVKWPEGIDVFEPVITDSLNKNAVPAEGSRTYSFSFTMDKPGKYKLPGIAFSFFNAGEGRFRIIYSDTIGLTITAAKNSPVPGNSSFQRSAKYGWWIAALAGVIAILLFFLSRARKKSNAVVSEPIPKSETIKFELDIHNLTDKQACTEIEKFLAAFKSKGKSLTPEQVNEIRSIREECQLLDYSGLSQEGKKLELFDRVNRLLTGLNLDK